MNLEIRCEMISQVEEEDHLFIVHLEKVWIENLILQIGRSEILKRMRDLDTTPNPHKSDKWLKS